jgi:hypothetical protein
MSIESALLPPGTFAEPMVDNRVLTASHQNEVGERMIVHFIKIFLAGAFVAAGFLRAAISSVHWSAAHFNFPNLSAPRPILNGEWEIVACMVAGVLFAVWSERGRLQKFNRGVSLDSESD